MSFNFPASPAVGALYPTPAINGKPQYRWDGEKWVSTVGLAGTGSVRYDTPQSLVVGEKTQARTNIDAIDKAYVDAGDTAAIGAANGKVAKTGDTMTGSLTSSGNLQGASVISNPGGVWSQASASTGTYYFGTSGGKYLTYDGSNFVLSGGGLYCGYLSTGANSLNCGELGASGSITAAGSVFANSGSLYTVSATGNVHVWFNDGPTNRAILYWERASGHMQFTTPGGTHVFQANGRFQTAQQGGYVTRGGMNAGAGANCYNINHTTGQQLWIDLTNMGNFYFTSDYRTKKDIRPLPSTWDIVKRLNPISYTNKDFTPPVQMELQKSYGEGAFMKGDDIPRIGFLAHELQNELGDGAASAYKDAPNAIQSPNPLSVLAAVTKALQEAMARIEELESAR